MVQIIDENRKRTGGENFAQAIQGPLESYSQYQQMQKQQSVGEALREAGGDPRMLYAPQEIQKSYAQSLFGKEKPETALQEATRKLKEAQLKDLEESQELDNLIWGRNAKPPSMGDQLQRGLPEEQMQGGLQQPDQEPFDKKKIPKDLLRQAASAAGQPGKRGQRGNEAKALLEEIEKQEKIQRDQYEKSPEFAREKILAENQARADSKYFSDLNERRSKQILKKESLSRLESMNKKRATGKAYESFLDKFGLTALTSEGRREYAAETKNQLTDFKQIAGSQLSAAEFFVLAGAYPNADFSPEANQAIIDNLKQVHDTLNKEDEIAHKLKKENKGKIPEDFQSKVNKELQEYVSKKIDKMKDNIRKIQNEQYGIPKGFTLMFDRQGEPLSVPDDKVVELIEGGLADLP